MKDKIKKFRPYLIGLAVLLILIVVLIYILPILMRTKTWKIANSISKLYDNSAIAKDPISEDIKSEEAYVIYSDEDGRNIAYVLKYKSSDEAKARELVETEKRKYIAEKSENNSIVLNEDYESYKKTYTASSNGIYILLIDDYYEADKDELIKKFNEAVKKYDGSNFEKENLENTNKLKEKMLKSEEEVFDMYVEMNSNSYNKSILDIVDKLDSCKGNECKELYDDVMQYEKYDDLKESVGKVNEKYNLILQEKKKIASTITNRITKLNTSLSQAEFDNIKKEISKLESDDYYKTYITNWNKSLSNVEAKIFKKASASINYKNALRTPENYKGKKVYWFGEVVQVIGSSQYRVNVNCTKYQYISGYSCSDTIYVKYYGSKNLIEDDMVKIWGTMDGNYTYETVLGSELTIPLVEAKYIDIVG